MVENAVFVVELSSAATRDLSDAASTKCSIVRELASRNVDITEGRGTAVSKKSERSMEFWYI